MHYHNKIKWINLIKYELRINIIDKSLKCSKISIREMITDNRNFLIIHITLNILMYLMMMVLKKYQSQNRINILISILRNSSLILPSNNKNNTIIQINNTNKILRLLAIIITIITGKLEIPSKEKREWKNNLLILNNNNNLINLIYLNSNMIAPKRACKTKMHFFHLTITILIKILLEMKGILLIGNNITQIL